MAQPTGDAGAPTPPTPLDGDLPSARRRSEFQRRAQATLLLEVAIADVTLGCHNRAYLVHRARDEIARRARYGQRLSLLLLTADGDVGPNEDALRRSSRRRTWRCGRPTPWRAGTGAIWSSCCRVQDSPALAVWRGGSAPMSPLQGWRWAGNSPQASASPLRSAGRKGWSC